MREFQERRKRKKILYSPWVAIILIGITVLIGLACIDLYKKYRVVREKADIAQRQYESYQAKVDRVQHNLDQLATPAGVERIIRENYSISRPNERVVIITDSSKSREKSDIQMRDVPITEKMLFMIKHPLELFK